MDKFIIGESSTKKTKRMLEYAKENNISVVCKNELSMRDKARNYGIAGLKIINYNDIDSLEENKIAIDELGEFFKYRFGVELDAFTMTTD